MILLVIALSVCFILCVTATVLAALEAAWREAAQFLLLAILSASLAFGASILDLVVR